MMRVVWGDWLMREKVFRILFVHVITACRVVVGK